jgi:hypothetical protein
MHQVFLPWPIGLELPLRNAELRAIAADTGNPGKFYIGRRLPAVFATAGLEPLDVKTIAIDRRAPLAEAEHQLLQSYLDELVERVRPFLDDAAFDQLRHLADPISPHHLLRQPHLTMTWINVLALARRGS